MLIRFTTGIQYAMVVNGLAVLGFALRLSVRKLHRWLCITALLRFPAIVLAAGFYLLMPFLTKRGMLPYYAYSLSLGVPVLAMLVASIVAYRLEGNPREWSALMTRFNYHPFSVCDLLMVSGIFAVEMALYLVMTHVTGWLIGQGIIILPAGFRQPTNSLDARDHQSRHWRATR